MLLRVAGGRGNSTGVHFYLISVHRICAMLLVFCASVHKTHQHHTILTYFLHCEELFKSSGRHNGQINIRSENTDQAESGVLVAFSYA